MVKVDESPRVATAPASLVAEKKISLVKCWALAGAALLVAEACIIVLWFTSGQATPTPTGPDAVPGFMQWWVRANEVVLGGGTLVVVYFLLIRPWRRQGHLTQDGMFVIAFSFIYFLDPMINYTSAFCTTNSFAVNFGSWVSNVPGWLTPNGHLFAEPIIWGGGAYPAWVFGSIIVCCALMRKVKARRPQISNLRLVMFAFAFCFTVDVIFELTWIRLGAYSYPGAIREFTLFAGKYYQVPVYEFIFFPAAWTAWVCLRFFRNDKGQTVVERGLENVVGSAKQRRGLQLLALIGAVQVLYIGLYMIPINIIQLNGGAWPEDMAKRSYLTNGLCGPGTSYACPGPNMPLNRPGSIHFAPDGSVVKTGEEHRYRPLDQ